MRAVRRAPNHLADLFPGFDRTKVIFVPHHMAHAASAYLAGPYRDCSVLVMDGRGETTSYLAGYSRGGEFTPLARVSLPHSLGLRYEELTMHLGFHRSSDEYKVMALAAYGTPRWAAEIRRSMHATGDGGFVALPIDLAPFTRPRIDGEPFLPEHADLAASVQAILQDVLLDLARWLLARTGDRALVMAGGVALNVVANSYIADNGPFENVWVQPAAGDAGTALGGALYVAHSAASYTPTIFPFQWLDSRIAAKRHIHVPSRRHRAKPRAPSCRRMLGKARHAPSLPQTNSQSADCNNNVTSVCDRLSSR